MILDVIDDILVLDDISLQLRPRHVNQLRFWGFIRAPGSGKYQINLENSILVKLQNYLSKHRISYSLSPSCQQVVTRLNEGLVRNERIRSLGEEFKEGKFDQTKFNHFSSFAESNIVRKLKKHQLKAAYHLYLVQNAANFSVPGSGKTSVVLAVFEKLRLEGKVDFLFVVGPPACFGPWKLEYELTLGREPDSRILAGGDQAQRKLEYYSAGNQTADLYLTTFQSLLNDKEEVQAFFKQRRGRIFLVIDEAHYIKQIGGRWANAAVELGGNTNYRCVLTGTPMPRKYSDVFNLFDFLWPENSPISSDTKNRIILLEDNNDSKAAKELLVERIGPLFYRVRKSDLGLIPPSFHDPIMIEMNRYERQIYNAIENKIRDYSLDDYLKSIDLITQLRRGRIIRLRQCVSYTKLLLKSLENYPETLIDEGSEVFEVIHDYDDLEKPAKLECLYELIQDLQRKKQKVVVWSNFIGTLKLIHSFLTQSGIYCKLIFGQTPIEQTSVEEEETREKIRNEFVDSESGLDVLIANPAVCGESISLHKTCFNAIYYDLSYNCAQYLQSLDRIHRVGGSEINQANYYFLQYKDTIDNDIKANLESKAQKMYDVIEEEYDIYSLDMFEETDEMQAYERLFVNPND